MTRSYARAIAVLGATFCLCLASLSLLLARSEPTQIQLLDPSESLQAAIDACSDGSTIQLGPGAFKGPLQITRAVTLVGAGREQTTIVAPQTASAVVLISGDQGMSVTIEDLGLVQLPSVTAGGRSDGDECHGLAAAGHCHVALRGLSIRDLSGCGIVLDDGCHAFLGDSSVEGNREDGVFLKGASHLNMSGCQLLANWRNGLSVEDHSTARLVDCEIRANDEHGAAAFHGSDLHVESCAIERNFEDGVHVTGASTVSLLLNDIRENVRYGVYTSHPENLRVCGGNSILNNHKEDISPGAVGGGC